ncbi:MAG: sialidase family protein, partial [Acidobacteria bacterium]|nr:sialidase family protein [Acidobacteriota bacterium]
MAWCSTPALHPIRHVVVFERPGCFAGWPANHGIWSWGDEILVGFDVAPFEFHASGHSVTNKHPLEQILARSRDGGETWTIEQPRELATPAGMQYQGFPAGTGPAMQAAPRREIDFTHRGFVFTARMTGNPGVSRFYYSYDYGKKWAGPFRLPDFGHRGSAARTDYIVNGRRDLTLFTTLAKADGLQGRVASTRTRDGGKSWTLVSYIGPEPIGE